jgi:uncharacterized membrane protein YhaH (DUF805 family)
LNASAGHIYRHLAKEDNMRGEILHYDDGTATGLITGEDGNRYGFALSAFRRPVPPLQGMVVDFITDGAGAAHEIYPIATTAPVPQFRPTPVAAIEPDLGLFGYFIRAITSYYANFSGRARRKEYWGFVLFYCLVFFLFGIIVVIGGVSSHLSKEAGGTSVSPLLFIGIGLMALFSLALIIPNLAITVRRLHDTGQSGWLLLLHLIPGIGGLILFVLMLIEGDRYTNAYGPPVK